MLIESGALPRYFTSHRRHYRNYPTVLARLDKLDAATLKGMLERRWKKIAPKKLQKDASGKVREFHKPFFLPLLGGEVRPKAGRGVSGKPRRNRASLQKTSARTLRTPKRFFWSGCAAIHISDFADNTRLALMSPISRAWQRGLLSKSMAQRIHPDAQLSHDTIRSAFLHAKGWRILRVWNGDVYKNLNGVLDAIDPMLPPPSRGSLSSGALRADRGAPPPP